MRDENLLVTGESRYWEAPSWFDKRKLFDTEMLGEWLSVTCCVKLVYHVINIKACCRVANVKQPQELMSKVALSKPTGALIEDVTVLLDNHSEDRTSINKRNFPHSKVNIHQLRKSYHVFILKFHYQPLCQKFKLQPVVLSALSDW